MARRSVSCVVVVENSIPVGMFTERDVVRCVADGIDLTTASVGDVMNSSIVTAPMTTAPYAAIGMMQERTVRRVLVVDDLRITSYNVCYTKLLRVMQRLLQGQSELEF